MTLNSRTRGTHPEKLGIRGLLAVVPSEAVGAPALVGLARPRIVLPRFVLQHLDRDDLRCVFLHELAHLKRRDILVCWVTSLLLVLHWFNPLIWLAFRTMRADREMACDAFSLRHLKPLQRERYGKTLLWIAKGASPPAPSVTGVFEKPSLMERRIAMIARYDERLKAWSPLGPLLLVALGCAGLPGAGPPAPSAQPASVPTLRQVKPEGGGFACVSYDGKYMCDIDWESGDLVVRELPNAEDHPLTKKGSWLVSDAYAIYPAISRDSKWVAYAWYRGEKDVDLCVVRLDGTGRRIVHRGEYIAPWDWSPDGRRILGILTEEEGSHIVWVSVGDGSVRPVTPAAADYGRVCLSPDGRLVAYERRQGSDPSGHDIFVFGGQPGRETPIVQHEADDRLLGFVPEGRRILFASNRMGRWDAWLVPLRGTSPAGPPEMVRPQIGDIHPVGFTRDGSYYYSIGTTLFDVWLAAFDPDAGALRDLHPLRHVGTDSLADWSPDGRLLAYAEANRKEKRAAIRIRSLETGEERRLGAALPPFTFLRWCPDGRSLLVTGLQGPGLQKQVLKIDAETGERAVLLRGRIRAAEFSPDGRRLFYQADNRLLVRDLDTGAEEERIRVGSPPAQIRAWALSRDGRSLAVSLRNERSEWILMTMPSGGGQRKVVLRESMKKNAFGIAQVAWMPEGKDLLFFRRLHYGPPLELWRIPAEGGEPRKIWTSKRNCRNLRVHPGGRRLAFTRWAGLSYEVWVMENFLPRPGSAE